MSKVFSYVRTIRTLAATAVLCAAGALAAAAQNSPCPFDAARLEFKGSPVEQARCLLRPNGIGGVLSPQLAKLPKPLESLVGRKVRVRVKALRDFIASSGFSEADLGGSLDEPLSMATRPDGSTLPALYFVIHDTSSPYLADKPFPPGFDDDPNWSGNKLDVWPSNPVAHIFVNRLGKSVTTTPFSETVRKGWGTKFARDVLKAAGKGLQIHIELIQPRRRDPADPNAGNDRFAPFPGFTGAQYDRLALLYACASVRRGTWLVPGYHSAYDAGIKDAHDDPQNFDLGQFAAALAKLLARVK